MTLAVLLDVIGDVARALPIDQVEQLASSLDVDTTYSKALIDQLAGVVPNPGFATQVVSLGRAWRKAPATTAPAVALALRSTSAAVARARGEQRVSTVWTGPTSPALPLRQTMGVLIQVVRAARERLLIVSFAAYKIPAVVAELHLAAEKGVAIVVVVDEQTNAGKAFKTLGVDASLYRWPLAGTEAVGGAKVRMHVKAAVADDHTALVGSANLTGQALSQNMELGILVEGGEVPRQLDRHFRKLVSSETLVPIGG